MTRKETVTPFVLTSRMDFLLVVEKIAYPDTKHTTSS